MRAPARPDPGFSAGIGGLRFCALFCALFRFAKRAGNGTVEERSARTRESRGRAGTYQESPDPVRRHAGFDRVHPALTPYNRALSPGFGWFRRSPDQSLPAMGDTWASVGGYPECGGSRLGSAQVHGAAAGRSAAHGHPKLPRSRKPGAFLVDDAP